MAVGALWWAKGPPYDARVDRQTFENLQLPRRPRLTALAFLLLAVPMLVVATFAAGALLITAAVRNPFDPRTYFQLCPVITGGTCMTLSGRQVLAVGAAAFVLAMALLIAGARRSRSPVLRGA